MVCRVAALPLALLTPLAWSGGTVVSKDGGMTGNPRVRRSQPPCRGSWEEIRRDAPNEAFGEARDSAVVHFVLLT